MGYCEDLESRLTLIYRHQADEEVPLFQQELNLSIMDVALATALDGSDTMEKMTCLGLFEWKLRIPRQLW